MKSFVSGLERDISPFGPLMFRKFFILSGSEERHEKSEVGETKTIKASSALFIVFLLQP
jgi:hypothetical protein